MKRMVFAFAVTALLTGSTLVADEQKLVEHYGAGSESERQLPFSDAVRVGNLLFLSGKIGNIPGTMDLAPGGIQGETRQTLENIKASLERAGSSMKEVVKCTVFLADIAEWAAMNEIYVEYFPENPPARITTLGDFLLAGALIEVDAIAYSPQD